MPKRRLLLRSLWAAVAAVAGCASFAGHDPVRVQLAGLQPLPGEGLEWRMLLKLRVQNPNDVAIDYDGAAVELQLRGQAVASGVSDERGSVPRFGETVLTVPVTISAFSAARQALGLAENIGMDEVPYVLRGKLAGGLFGTQRFVEKGTLNMSGAIANPYRRP